VMRFKMVFKVFFFEPSTTKRKISSKSLPSCSII
jgi:hypothetical protein